MKCSTYFDCDVSQQYEYSRDGNLVYIKCNNCGLIWRAPESMHISKPYDKSYFDSKNYLKNRKHKIKKSEGLLRIAQHFKSDIRNILEVGCSVGNTLQAAKNMGVNHLGIDISSFAVDFCKNEGLNAENLTLDQLIASGKQFNLIFMQHVLEHFPDPFETLKQCKNLLKNYGLIVILVPNSHYRNARKKRGKHRFYSLQGVGAEHFVYFDYSSLAKVLELTGFKVIQKNYPVFVKKLNSPASLLNRLVRKSLSVFGIDQELVVVAQKI
jgi:2-polyprenyl-3-methyl-5-hydroxy-6-metoxy-1,4-benzoquinol methylase